MGSSKCMLCGTPVDPTEQVCRRCLHTSSMPTYEQEEPSYFEAVIYRTLERAKLSDRYMDVLKQNISAYEKAFTAKSYDPDNNYEIMEFIGDGFCNMCISNYFMQRFPYLNCKSGLKIYGRLKINYVSKTTFAEIAENLGFFPHIKASDAEKNDNKQDLLEDTFEAFIGTTATIMDREFGEGMGYAVIYRLIENIFDYMDIDLNFENLYDEKTVLKEIFDRYPELGKIHYVDKPTVTTLFQTVSGKPIQVGIGMNLPTLAKRQRAAAKDALSKHFSEYMKPFVDAHNDSVKRCIAEYTRAV